MFLRASTYGLVLFSLAAVAYSEDAAISTTGTGLLPEPPLLWTQTVGQGNRVRAKSILTGKSARGRVIVSVNNYDPISVAYAAEASIRMYDTSTGRPLMLDGPYVIGKNNESCVDSTSMPEFLANKDRWEAMQEDGFDDLFFLVVRDCSTGRLDDHDMTYIRRIIAYDPQQQAPRWVQEVANLTSIAAPRGGDALYASFKYGTTAFSSADGSVLWTSQSDKLMNDPNVTSPGTVMMTTSTDGSRLYGNNDPSHNPGVPVLFSTDVKSGALLDTKFEENARDGGIAAASDGDWLYQQDTSGVNKLFAENLASSPMWMWNNFTNGRASTQTAPVISKDSAYVYAVSYEGGLAKINTETGLTEWLVEFEGDDITPEWGSHLTLSPNDDFIYLELRSGLYKINSETAGKSSRDDLYGCYSAYLCISPLEQLLILIFLMFASKTPTQEKEWIIPSIFDYSLADDGNSIFTVHKDGIRAYSTWLPPTVVPTTSPTASPATATPTEAPVIVTDPPSTAAPTDMPTREPTDPSSSGTLVSTGSFCSTLVAVSAIVGNYFLSE